MIYWNLQEKNVTLINTYQPSEDLIKLLIEHGPETSVRSKDHIFIVNSVIPVEFKKFIMEAVAKNEQMYSTKRRDEIEVTAEFAKIFNEPKTYSSCRNFIITFYRRQRKIQPITEAASQKTEHRKRRGKEICGDPKSEESRHRERWHDKWNKIKNKKIWRRKTIVSGRFRKTIKAL